MFSGGMPSRARSSRAELRDRQERRAPVEQAQRQPLEQPEERQPEAAELPDVELAVDVVDHRHARLAQPQRREERDAVDHLEHDVGVAADAAQHGQDRPREDRARGAHPVHDQPRPVALDALGAGVVAGHDGDLVAPVHPAADLRVRCWRRCRPCRGASSPGRRGPGCAAVMRLRAAAMGRKTLADLPGGDAQLVASLAASPVSSRWMPRSVWLFLPTYNEAENLERDRPRDARQLERARPGDWRLLVVDDASPDGTGELADRLAARAATASRCCTAQGKEGLGQAYLAGFEHALDARRGVRDRHGRRLLARPAHLPAMIAAAAGRATWCSGSRYVRGRPDRRSGRRCAAC